MVEVKAYMDGEGINTDVKLEGFGEDVAAEVLTIIATLMKEMKDSSIHLHAMMLQTIAEDKSILLGDYEGEEREMN